MALIMADHTSDLAPQETKPLHPFFGRNWPNQRTHSFPQNGSQDSAPLEHPSFIPQQLSDTHTGASGHTNHKQSQSRRTSSENAKSQTSTPIELSASNSTSQENSASAVMESEKVDNSGAVESNNLVSLTVDPNEDRRKRRRTDALPNQSLGFDQRYSQQSGEGEDPYNDGDRASSWKSQLEAAADASVWPSDHTSPGTGTIEPSSPVLSMPIVHQKDEKSIYTSQAPTSIPPDAHSQDPQPTAPRNVDSQLKMQDDHISAEGTDHIAEAPRDLSAEVKSPKIKMLKLNAQGTLGSPVARKMKPDKVKDSQSQSSPKKRRKTSKKSLKVVFRYCTSEKSRLYIGQRIQEIMAGAQAGASKESDRITKDETTDTAQLEKPESEGLRKTTHPFFLGKLSKKPEQPSETAHGEFKSARTSGGAMPVVGSDTEELTVHSPRKPQSFPKKISQPHNISTLKLFSGGGSNSNLRYPGAVDAAWPWKGIVHVKGEDHGTDITKQRRCNTTKRSELPDTTKKLKGAVITIPKDEDILCTLAGELGVSSKSPDLANAAYLPHGTNDSALDQALRVPRRHLITATDIQAHLHRELESSLPSSAIGADGLDPEDELHSTEKYSVRSHPAIVGIYNHIPKSLTAFDRGQCETQIWLQKYAPKSTVEVLQPGQEPLILRDWLKSLTVRSVDTSTTNSKRSASKDRGLKRKKKRRARGEGLDDFIISSDEEADEMDVLTDPDESQQSGTDSLLKKTVIRAGDMATESGRMTNAVVISGPSGCGKTAAVYAVAHELSFEVFEINSGSRRSGKDLLERVGHMTRNHLVHQSREDSGSTSADEDMLKAAEVVREEIESGKQGTMDSFFKSQSSSQRKSKPTTRRKQTAASKKSAQHAQQRPMSKQKQSLILLEEVDILFEEDKQFWTTVLSLMAQSKRPVIMTCNDESHLPLDDLSLHAILRFSAPREPLVVDYLLTMAASEGHLLKRDAIRALYRSKQQDLRASIMELEFWCQMGVGDRKGGLEWILDRWPRGSDLNIHGEKLRVTSEDTYRTGMGWVSNDFLSADHQWTISNQEELLTEAWDNWGIDVRDWQDMSDTLSSLEVDMDVLASSARYNVRSSLDTYSDALSASDVWAVPGFRTNDEVPMDPEQPKLSEKTLISYTEGDPLIQADELVDYSRTGLHMAISTHILAKAALREQLERVEPKSGATLRPVSEEDIIRHVMGAKQDTDISRPLTHADLSLAFAPIASPPKLFPAQVVQQTLTSFDRPVSVVAEDVAPYVRTIVTSDIQLEQYRVELSNLLSQGARDGKRVRTTRASRSALEGGDRKTTRKEKWLPNGTNAQLVLKTGGSGWQNVAARRPVMPPEEEDDSKMDEGE